MFALWMLELGYSVFPLYRGSKRPNESWLYANGYSVEHQICGGAGCLKCRNGHIGSWKKCQVESMSQREVRSWANDGWNVGLVTGELSDTVVLDFDSEESWQNRLGIIGQTIEAAVIIKTKRGYHAYFRHPGESVRNRTQVNGKIDVRGDGGYVVGPTSKVDGFEYRVIRGSLSDRSNWPVFDLGWLPKRKAADEGDRQNVRCRDRYKDAILRGEFEQIAKTQVGGRRDQILRSATKLGSYVAGRVLEHGEAYWGLVAACESCRRLEPQMSQTEIESAIMSGLTHGGKQPRGLN